MRKLTPKEEKSLNEVKSKIKEEMLLWKIYYKKAKFVCYADSCATFNYTLKTGEFIETNFICDDSFGSKLSFQEILNLKRIFFLWQRIFDNDGNIIGDIKFRVDS